MLLHSYLLKKLIQRLILGYNHTLSMGSPARLVNYEALFLFFLLLYLDSNFTDSLLNGRFVDLNGFKFVIIHI